MFDIENEKKSNKQQNELSKKIIQVKTKIELSKIQKSNLNFRNVKWIKRQKHRENKDRTK